jgi:thiosulfate sulfurtransferase
MKNLLGMMMAVLMWTGCLNAQQQARQGLERALAAGAAAYAPSELGMARTAMADGAHERALEHANAAAARATLVRGTVALRQAQQRAEQETFESGRKAEVTEHADLRDQVKRAPLPPGTTQLDAHAVHALVKAGKARVVDVRSAQAFALGHVGGAWRLSALELRHTPLDTGVTWVLYGQHGDDAALKEALDVLHARAVKPVAVLQGGLTAWQHAGLPWAGGQVRQDVAPAGGVDAHALATRLAARERNLVVVDVRGAPAWRAGHLPGAVVVEPQALVAYAQQLPVAAQVVVVASHPDAAQAAARTLQVNSTAQVMVLSGGVEAYVANGHRLLADGQTWSLAMGEVP